LITEKWTINTREQQDIMKRGVCHVGVEILLICKENFKFSLCISNRPPVAKNSCLQFQGSYKSVKVKILRKNTLHFCKETMSQGQQSAQNP
jgi:hypothetical protein